jgi:soluble lytic murein transglycosylase-like protein
MNPRERKLPNDVPRRRLRRLGLKRVFAICAALCAAPLLPSTARADGFSYVDRDGREHVVTTDAAAPSAAADSPPLSRPRGPGPGEDGFVYDPFIDEAAHLYGLPRELLCAVMKVESGGNPTAVSSSGALGLMQLMPSTAADLGVTDAFDPRQNVLGGARFLRILVNTFVGDLHLALAAYHAGAGRVQRSGGMPDIPATRKYVAAVLSTYHRFERVSTLALLALPARQAQ